MEKVMFRNQLTKIGNAKLIIHQCLLKNLFFVFYEKQGKILNYSTTIQKLIQQFIQHDPNNIQMVKQQCLWVCATLAILIIGISAEQDSTLGIYGVRWFLGEHFTYTIDDDSDNNEYFVLAFNTPKQIQGEISVIIAKNKFTCTSEFISTKNYTIHHEDDVNFTNNFGDDIVDQAYLHKCVIGNIRTITNSISIKTISYSIVLDSLYITQSVNPAIDKFSRKNLYNGTFRLPYYQSSFQAVVIGDWGQIRQDGRKKGYVDPLPCILKKVKQNENIVIVLFTGDLAYDLQGGKYYSMLKYMQPLTSQITFVAAPGNHDTLYHADTFELFTKSYYTPQFWSYSNYFNKFSIGRLLFIVYNPQLEQFDFNHPDRLKKNLTSIFETEFSDQVIKSIKSQYFPIVFSHYPIYCSDINDDYSSCERNPERFKPYRNYFNKLDMKLYLSGHLHVYERTAPICFNGSFIRSDSDQYNMSCPIYVVEGVGGSDIYLQMKDQYPKKEYSQSLVYNTGFGILTINTDNQASYPRSASYQHISAPRCQVADHFKMTNTLLADTVNTTASSGKYHYIWVMMLKSAIACIIIGVLIVLTLYVRRRYGKSTPLVRSDKNIQKQNHVEMVEQNFDGPQSNKSEKIGTQ